MVPCVSLNKGFLSEWKVAIVTCVARYVAILCILVVTFLYITMYPHFSCSLT